MSTNSRGLPPTEYRELETAARDWATLTITDLRQPLCPPCERS